MSSHLYHLVTTPAPSAPPPLFHSPLSRLQQKNVTSDATMGKTGRIYLPSQPVGTMALAKMKGLKRERRQEAAERKQKRHRGKGEGGEQ